ncbi:hypothetical protein GCM10025855_00230 [Shewanella glacialipiscicola]|uniref:Uncharacterized protein n=1 Tax=Shewanella glacialipiscicola TaxID=614069 RepID=A0ABQ6IX76_9GAMM|nr:hypothetical protein GCM10025855_00230 [Shewanella glacialipiscicola]
MSAAASEKIDQWAISASQRVLVDPLLDCLVLLTEHFGNPCSSDSLAAGLPMSGAVLTPDLVPCRIESWPSG